MAQEIIIKQGDQYYLPITIKDKLTKEAIQIQDVSVVEVYFGATRHLYPDGDMELDDNTLLMPLTQQETFALKAGKRVFVDVRIKYPSGDVVGTEHSLPVTIAGATSREVL